MPELPDVETCRRRSAHTGLHRPIGRVEVPDPAMLHGVERDRLRRTLRGREPTTTRRHGKHLFAKAGELDAASRRGLHLRIGRVLGVAIGGQADPSRLPRSWLLRHRQDGATCPRGDGRVRRLRPQGRGSFCRPTRQPSPRS